MGAYPAGHVVTADEFNALAAIRTTDLSRTNNTVTADPILTVPLVASATYHFRAALLYQRGAGSMSISFTAPTGATYSWTQNALDPSVTDLDGAVGRNDHVSGTAELGGIKTSNVWAFPEGYVITSTTAGSLTLTWAQATTNATAAILRAGSRLMAQRIG